MACALGIDTSNYTTSAALFDGKDGYNLGKLLEVPDGSLGLRQSDALFQHVKRLPALIHALRGEGRLKGIEAVGASTRPRAVDGSYMPCFLAGESAGSALADVLEVPFFRCSHQQGHIAAAAWSAGHAELLERPHLAWHLSGGTTELLYVEPEGGNVRAECVGGTSDISAGQLLDRTGKLLGIAFPAGRALDALAQNTDHETYFSVKLQDLCFSLSGVENQVKALAERGARPDTIAAFAINTVVSAVRRTTEAALVRWPGLRVLCSGGVASSQRLRAEMPGAIFALPQYSADNALGVAILTGRALERGTLL